MNRIAYAQWMGSIKEGSGTLSTQSGVLKQNQYSFSTRFENGVGTNPEELIAAAHAGCFSMALSAMLGAAGMKPESIDTKASVKIEKQGDGWSVTGIHLDVSARVPGAAADQFQAKAEEAKAKCPISRLLSGAPITMTATLEG